MSSHLQPAYILRGHPSPVHALHFFRHNTRLLTGDASGHVVLWDTATFRPTCAWRAHTASILGLGSWSEDKIITHGRDSKLQIYSLPPEAERTLASVLPVDDALDDAPRPWLLHCLQVHTLNFCAFSSCVDLGEAETLLVAVPGAKDGTILVYALPAEDAHSAISTNGHANMGMLMALSLGRVGDGLTLVAGFETGATIVWRFDNGWKEMMRNQGREQPVLSLALRGNGEYWVSGADAWVDRIGVDGTSINTKHAGQQGLVLRSDGKIIATAGWDGRGRVYNAQTLEALAVLAWHKDGCYTAAFADVHGDNEFEQNNARTTVAQRRANRTRTTHWLALGSKDGKVSLWEVF